MNVAKSGIFLAINSIFLLGTNYIPINTISLLALASLMSAFVIIELDLKTGVVFTIASLILSSILIHNKFHSIVYIVTFGNYGVVKYIIESKFKLKMQYVIKIVYSLLAFSILYIIARNFINVNFKLVYILGLEILYFIYDYIYSHAIEYYIKTLRPKMIK